MELLPLIAGVAALLSACASIGRPQGGARDEKPPVYLRSNPGLSALNFTSNKLDIYFDENIKLDDPGTRVVISPAQKQMPRINANGRHLSVELQDTMLDNTTYTIDFADAIRDLNEGNILDGFAIDFSTGDTLDSLRISGMVVEAATLEPAQGMLVGVYDNLDDSAITTLPFLRIAKTNQLGQFTIRGLKPGTYHVFAVNDVNRDYKWDRSEDIAFYPEAVTPSVEQIVVTDTLTSVTGQDSTVIRDGVRYLPNDLLLTWYNENRLPQYLKDYSRPDSVRISIIMAAPADSLPELTVVSGPAAGRRLDLPDASKLQHTAKLDTLTYWLTDSAVYHLDSLQVALRYMRTDTLEQLSWTTDTLRFNYKAPKPEKKEPKKRKKNDDEEADSQAVKAPEIKFMTLNVGSSSQEVNEPLVVTVTEPIATLDPKAWHFEVEKDSVWSTLPTPTLLPDSTGNLLRYTIEHAWTPGATYRISVDSATVTTPYGLFNGPVSQTVKVKTEDEYSTIIFRLTSIPDSTKMAVQILSTNDTPIRTVIADANGVAKFDYLKPGTYYARAFTDRNGDGLWTTGSLEEHRLPEDVYYYPKKINLKKNWDITNDWNLDETPVDLQKPMAIKKNKPKTKDKSQDDQYQDYDEDDEMYDQMGRPGYDNRNPFDNSRKRNGRTGNNFNNTNGQSNFQPHQMR